MEYSQDDYSIPSEYEPFQPPKSSTSSSEYFDDGFDDQRLNDLVDTVEENQNYASSDPVANLYYERNQPETANTLDRYQTPVAQAQSEGDLFEQGGNFGSEAGDRRPFDSAPMTPESTWLQQPNHEPVNSRPGQSSTRSFENLMPVAALPKPYLSFFGFSHFNSIQTKCFSVVYKTNHNVLTSAPTGSGKTVLFELAMLRMLEYNQSSKAVYMAPTKSLCAERFRDWSNRFDYLGIKCVELTGDSENAGLTDAKLANIIITTPEKWDSMTRRWFEFTKLLSTLRLICIDEVHMLNEERGSVLEVIVARMKTLGTNIRFIAVSATVPNISDVAEWLGDGGVADQKEKALPGQASAKTFIFGEEHRPVKLSKFVYGFPRRPEHTEYQFMSLLNFKTLIFCGTRKSSLQAAETLSKAYQKMVTNGEELPWDAPRNPETFSDKKLTELCTYGIGIHHAGLDQNDRRQTEKLFLSNTISVLCTTSTLSVGVNLPARCVIIRGSKTYRGGTVSREGFEDYSDLDLFQMMGRAGRPQFDDEGVVVVMTSQNDKMRIEKLVKSQTMLESWFVIFSLHTNLTEHINSEIYMGTITSRTSAIDWLENSFLSVRIKKNAKHYSISEADVAPEKQLATFADDALNVLVEDGLIEEDGDHTIGPTDLGEIMSKFCLRHKTFLGIIRMKPDATMRNILEVISGAEEFSTLRLRAGEGIAYKALNSHPELKFPLSVKVTQTWHKVMLLIQAVLGGIPLTEVKSENTNPVMEVNMIWQHLPRICKCLVALSISQHNIAIKNSLELLRSVTARAWDDSPWVLRQFDQIGEKSVKRLVDSGVSTIEKLQNTSSHRIEMILDRNPPFGMRIARQACSVPRFFCKMETISETVVPEGVHVCVEIIVGLSDTSETTAWKWKNSILMATVFVMTNDQQWIEFRTIQVKLLRETKRFNIECILIKPSQTLITYIACTQIAGTGLSIRWKPQTSRERYPKPETITDDQAASIEVLKGLRTRDLVISDSESECEIAKPLPQVRCPTRQTKTVPRKENPKISTSSKGKFEHKRNPLGVRERLKNGRWKCAHKCKGDCHHLCCKEGVAKPPRIRAEKHLLSPPPTASQRGPSLFLPSNDSASSSKPDYITDATLKNKNDEKFHQASPGNSYQTGSNKATRGIKPLRSKKPSKVENSIHDSDLPSLTELEGFPSPERKEARSQSGDNIKETSRIAANIPQPGSSSSVRFSGSHSSGIGKGVDLLGKYGEESAGRKELNDTSEYKKSTGERKLHDTSGIEKFRNKTQILNDFDEKEIFHQRKEFTPPGNPLEIAQKKPFSETKNQPTHTNSSSSYLQSAPTKSNNQDCAHPQNPEDEDEIDELDEDWDIKIFEGYLSPNPESVDASYNSTQLAKRNIEQLGVKEQSSLPKKPRTDFVSEESFSNDPLASVHEHPYTLESENMKAGVDEEFQSGSLEDPSVGKRHTDADFQANCNCDSDLEDEPDPLMEMVDEVMAWAELHVAKD